MEKEYIFKFKLICKYQSSSGLVDIDANLYSHPYIDVISQPDFKEMQAKQTRRGKPIGRVGADEVTVKIDFQDWKWLSNHLTFKTVVKDPKVISG